MSGIVQYAAVNFYRMEFKSELQKLKKEVDREIEIYLNYVIEETEKTDFFVASTMRYFKKTILAGGKRIRPIMMYWGYIAAGGKDCKEIIKASISIELIHAFLLMHDDIIDRDDLRRGKKTVHAKYRDYHKRFLQGNDSDHFGISVSIVLGDLVYSLGNRVLFSSKFDSEIIVRALNKMQNIVGLTCIGEVQDVYMEYSKKTTEKDILSMYENKTARYTFDGPLKLGAMLAGANDRFCDQLSTFTIPVGVAFQVRDDILGVFGSEKKTGKPVGSDIAEGKKTLLVSRAYKKADGKQKKILNSLLGKKDLTKSDVVTFQNVLVETGAKTEAEEYMDKLISDAHTALEKANLPKDARAFLYSLASYLNNREN